MKNCLLKWENCCFPRGPMLIGASLRTFFLLLFCFSIELLFAQQTIQGTVTGAGGNLSGATVQVKGATTATQTDNNGKFSIAVVTYYGWRGYRVITTSGISREQMVTTVL